MKLGTGAHDHVWTTSKTPPSLTNSRNRPHLGQKLETSSSNEAFNTSQTSHRRRSATLISSRGHSLPSGSGTELDTVIDVTHLHRRPGEHAVAPALTLQTATHAEKVGEIRDPWLGCSGSLPSDRRATRPVRTHRAHRHPVPAHHRFRRRSRGAGQAPVSRCRCSCPPLPPGRW